MIKGSVCTVKLVATGVVRSGAESLISMPEFYIEVKGWFRIRGNVSMDRVEHNTLGQSHQNSLFHNFLTKWCITLETINNMRKNNCLQNSCSFSSWKEIIKGIYFQQTLRYRCPPLLTAWVRLLSCVKVIQLPFLSSSEKIMGLVTEDRLLSA